MPTHKFLAEGVGEFEELPVRYRAWLRLAARGDRLIYWVGNLARDRCLYLGPDDKPAFEDVAPGDCIFSFDEAAGINKLADDIFEDAKAGVVILVQRRRRGGDIEYLAIRTAKLAEKVSG